MAHGVLGCRPTGAMQWTRAGLIGAVLVILGLVYGGRSSTGSARPVVAVVVSGAMRTLPECRRTVWKHVVEANPSLEFHFYVYLTVDTEAEVRDAQQLVSHAYPNVKSVLVLNGKQTSKAVRVAHPEPHWPRLNTSYFLLLTTTSYSLLTAHCSLLTAHCSLRRCARRCPGSTGCNPRWRRLQPYMLEAATLCAQVRKALPGLDRLQAGSGTARGKASNIAKML